jgi:hypothetical protein
LRPPLPISLLINEETNWSVLPASPGVAMLCGADFASTQTAVQISATGDVREFCRARLDPAAELGPRADLRPVTSVVHAAPVGSAFEADWLTLELARAHLPKTYKAIADRWRGWFLLLDPAASPPTWRKTDLRDLVDRADSPPASVLLGPLPDKHAVAKLGELLDDAFELCRYPRELGKAPCGSACAYKDMGCPAACDGSETLTAYVRRVELARDFAATARGEQDPTPREIITAQMNDAATAQRFEHAARMKKRLERLDDIGKPMFRNLGELGSLAVVAVLPSERSGHARVMVFAGGELEPIADVDGAAVRVEGGAALGPVLGVIAARAQARAGFPLSTAAVERLGLLCQYWFKPRSKQRKRRATFFDLRRGIPEPAAMARAIATAAAPTDHPAGHPTDDGEISETDLSDQLTR